LFELLTGKPPFYKSTRDSLFENIKNSYNLEVPTHVSPIAIDLLGRLLNKIPSKRLGVKSFEDLKSHEFFSEIDWTALARKN
jgi:serine/threonine protein kinase